MTLEHDAVRDMLIGATLTLMDEGGLEAVKARPLAQAAGVSVGTIYNLFGNVDGLVMAANERIYADLNALGQSNVVRIETELAQRIAQGRVGDTARDRVRERLLGLSGVYIDFVGANSRRWGGVLAFNRGHAAAEAGDDYLAQLDALIDIIGRVLEGAPSCADPVYRRKTARALWSAVHGIVTMNYSGDSSSSPERALELISILVTTFVEGLFVGEPA